MLRISENVGEEPGAELDTRRAAVMEAAFWCRGFWAPIWEGEGAPRSWMLGNDG